MKTRNKVPDADLLSVTPKIILWGHKLMLLFLSLTGLSAVLLSAAALFQDSSDPDAQCDAFTIPSKPKQLWSVLAFISARGHETNTEPHCC